MGETTSLQIDHNHPLFLAVTDTPGVTLHGIKLTGPENYDLWSRSMRMALLVKNKLGFIEGTCLKSSYKGELANQWERCNAIVLSWIGRTAYALVIQEESQQERNVLKVLYNGKVMGIGREDCGLYVLKWRDKPVVAMVTKETDESKLWHMILGHPSIIAMKHIYVLKNKLIHLDVWGPHKLPTYNREYYFLTIVDDFSGYTWVCLLQSKFEVVTVLKDFLIMIKTQFDMNVKVLRSDNGKEFFNSSCNELLASLGIVHQNSCPYTPQQNGVVERKHRHILEVARALNFQSSLPSRFWEIASKHNLPKGDKSVKRARKSVFIGYSEVQKGYRLFDLETKTIFVSRDFIFRKHIFPFKENATTSEDCLSTQVFLPIQPDSSSPTPTTNLQESHTATYAHIQPTDTTPVLGYISTPAAEGVEIGHATQNTEAIEVEHEVQDTSAELIPDTEPKIPVVLNTSMLEPIDAQGSRKTTRTSKPPVWLKDYQTTKKFSGHCLYPLYDTLAYANLTTGYQTYLQAFLVKVEPSTLQQASTDSRWVATMQ
ncbi:uncharacterized protein LOC142167060 [Nicotiana tabacum]|uniref:Uncharacterized protein LOC142167060 n=1 Tax=Nicotiana tabacum TaxID=4097 RepID=A0AC58SED1_TOBAC